MHADANFQSESFERNISMGRIWSRLWLTWKKFSMLFLCQKKTAVILYTTSSCKVCCFCLIMEATLLLSEFRAYIAFVAFLYCFMQPACCSGFIVSCLERCKFCYVAFEHTLEHTLYCLQIVHSFHPAALSMHLWRTPASSQIVIVSVGVPFWIIIVETCLWQILSEFSTWVDFSEMMSWAKYKLLQAHADGTVLEKCVQIANLTYFSLCQNSFQKHSCGGKCYVREGLSQRCSFSFMALQGGKLCMHSGSVAL